MTKNFSILLFLVALVAAFPAAAKVITIDVNKMVFSPEKITAQVGDVVEWNNSDIVVHTATEKNKKWEVMLPVKGKDSITIKEQGTIEYYCKFHPNMKGEIEVSK